MSSYKRTPNIYIPEPFIHTIPFKSTVYIGSTLSQWVHPHYHYNMYPSHPLLASYRILANNIFDCWSYIHKRIQLYRAYFNSITPVQEFVLFEICIDTGVYSNFVLALNLVPGNEGENMEKK